MCTDLKVIVKLRQAPVAKDDISSKGGGIGWKLKTLYTEELHVCVFTTQHTNDQIREDATVWTDVMARNMKEFMLRYGRAIVKEEKSSDLSIVLKLFL